MISLQEFRASTNSFGKRISITAVETKLSAYLNVITGAVDLDAALRAVRELRDAADAYVQGHQNSSRRPGVDKVVRLAVFEERMLTLLVEAKNMGGEVGARAIIKCRDLQEKIMRAATPQEEASMAWLEMQIDTTWNDISGLHVNGVGKGRDTTDEGSALIMEDIHVLRRISNNSSAPGVLRACLKQILSPGVVGQLKPMILGSGAKYNRFPDKDGTKMKYALNHPIYLLGGKDIRVGGLAHELTHICVAEVFNCTAVILSIPRDFSDVHIKNLGWMRDEKLNDLQDQILGDVELGSRRLERLKKEMINRCEYGRGQKFTFYVTGFERYLVEEEGQQFYDRLKKLGNEGLSSAVIEYDSVINQMLVWCHTHGLSFDNPVYLRLQQLAGDELLRRQRAIPKPKLASRPARRPLPPRPGAPQRPLPPTPGVGGPPPIPPKPGIPT